MAEKSKKIEIPVPEVTFNHALMSENGRFLEQKNGDYWEVSPNQEVTGYQRRVVCLAIEIIAAVDAKGKIIKVLETAETTLPFNMSKGVAVRKPR